MNIKLCFLTILIGVPVVFLAGCSDTAPVAEKYDASPYLLTTEPEGAEQVIPARETAKDQAEVVVVGRIGGDLDPWVKGVAAFTIVDSSIRACSDGDENGEPCSCKTPWDYCCELNKLPNSMVLVKIVDKDSNVIPQDAKENFGVKELDTVTVKGKIKCDENGGMSILASGIYIHK